MLENLFNDVFSSEREYFTKRSLRDNYGPLHKEKHGRVKAFCVLHVIQFLKYVDKCLTNSLPSNYV